MIRRDCAAESILPVAIARRGWVVGCGHKSVLDLPERQVQPCELCSRRRRGEGRQAEGRRYHRDSVDLILNVEVYTLGPDIARLNGVIPSKRALDTECVIDGIRPDLIIVVCGHRCPGDLRIGGNYD